MDDINQPISKKLPYLELYLEDIEKIIAILSLDNPTSIKLEADNKEFEFKEIKELKTEKINNLKICAHFPEFEDFTITLDKYGADIYCFKDKTVYQGIAKKIDDYLKNKIRPFGRIAKSQIPNILIGALLPIMGAYSGSIFYKFYNVEGYKNTTSIMIGVLLLILFIFSVILSSYYKNVIFLKHRSHYKNFFIRNKDQLFIQLLVGLIIAVFSFFLGRMSIK